MTSARSLMASATIALASAVGAQPHATDPAQPAAAAQPLSYRSAFDGYRRLDDGGAGNWRQVNDRVRDAAAKAPHPGAGAAAAAPAKTPVAPDPRAPANPHDQRAMHPPGGRK